MILKTVSHCARVRTVIHLEAVRDSILIQNIVEQATEPLKQAIEAGMPMSQGQAVQLLSGLRDAALEQVRDQARSMAHRMECKMEDQI